MDLTNPSNVSPPLPVHQHLTSPAKHRACFPGVRLENPNAHMLWSCVRSTPLKPVLSLEIKHAISHVYLNAVLISVVFDIPVVIHLHI